MSAMKNLKFWQIWSSVFIICLASVLTYAEKNFDDSFKDWNTIGPTGGDVRSIKIDPNNANHLYVTTLDGQLHQSFDAGKTWRLVVNLNRPQLVLDNLIIDSRNPNTLYIAGHRHKQPGGFFKSIDGGKTWKESKELSNEAIHAMEQSSKDPNMLLAGSVNGIWVSKDSGDTWNRYTSSSTPEKLDAFAVDPRDPDTIYAGTWYRPYKSTDGGNSWRLIKDGMIDDSDVFAIDINPVNPDHVIAAACSGIYLSYNKGEKWKKVQGIPSQSRRTRDIMHNPGKPGYVYAGTTEGLWMSTNGGASWRLTTSKTIEINSIAVHPDSPDRVFIGTNNYGVMVSNDAGKSFVLSNGNFTSRFTYKIIPDIEKPNRLYSTTINTATGGGYIFISDDAGLTWKPSVTNFDTDRTISYSFIQDKVNPDKIYLATNFGIFQSINRGESWNQIEAPKVPQTTRRKSRRSRRSRAAVQTPPAPKGFEAALESKVNVLSHTEDGKNGYFAGTNQGLYKSYDIAKGWQKVEFGEGIDEQVFAVHVSPKMPQVIWVGTAISGVIMSNDGGETWSKVPTIPEGVPISAIVSNPEKPENIYVGTTQTLFMSKDWGKTWMRRGGNLPLGNFNSILINPENTSEMYVASAREANGGIFFSEDSGYSWKRIDADKHRLASNRVWSLVFDPVNKNQLLAGTHSSGIYQIKRTIPVNPIIEVEDNTIKAEIVNPDGSNQ
jgi:photosystem II stability/assembly factor-like uncharacterized protein